MLLMIDEAADSFKCTVCNVKPLKSQYLVHCRFLHLPVATFLLFDF